MADTETAGIPEVALTHIPTTRQQLFMRYFVGTLVDLVVLNLFAEFWDRVIIEAFSYSLLAAILLQVLLKATLKVEHAVAVYFKTRTGLLNRLLRMLATWAVLFISKLIMLYALGLAVGDAIQFTGNLHGLVAFLVVVFGMLAAEEVVVRFYRRLK